MFIATLLLTLAPVQAAPTPGPASPAAAATLGLDTPVEQLMANPKSKAVVDANIPQLAGHPSYEMFKGMSLNQLAPMSNGQLTDETLKKVGEGLAAIK